MPQIGIRLPAWRQVGFALWCLIALLSSIAWSQAVPAVPTAPSALSLTGRLAGRVIDRGTGRPLASVRIRVVGIAGVVETDLDGRFRTPPISVGPHSIIAALIGYKAVQMDSVLVEAGQTKTVSIALSSAPVQLEELQVVSDRPAPVSSAAGMLAAQQAAMAVVDGVSAETISRTPDSDAGQAITRVTGLAVVQDKVVVRGLSERYSGSLLNGVEIASPEPEKKFVSMDIFAASLIESIIAAKTATPDRPGDFAGGIVDIQTKEFPENFVFSFGVSQGYNSRSTFKTFPRAPRSGRDRFGFDGRKRAIGTFALASERFAESLNPVWTPASERALPALGADFSLGGRKDFGNDVFGFILSLNYSTGRDYNPDRFDASGIAPFRIQEANERVELGGIFNLAYRLGGSHKFGFKNFYSRSSRELIRQAQGGDGGEGPSLNYQGDYVQQFVQQTQLTGDHSFPGFLNSRIEWKGSYGRAGFDDLDNRQIRYIDTGFGFTLNPAIPAFRHNLEMLDKSYSGQVDWSIPFSLRAPGDALIKVGGLYRKKDRDFDAGTLEIDVGDNLPNDVRGLPPEQLLAPENLGPGLLLYEFAAGGLASFIGREEVKAGYGMLDFELLPSVRIVAGARWEEWTASLTEENIVRAQTKGELLWSANMSYALSSSTNFRLAGYRTVARPDLRELSKGGYPADIGGNPVIGDTTLVSSSILNGDARFEVYPAPEELFAISVFYKRFDRPLLVIRRDAGGIVVSPVNGERATSLGAEFEFRKRLGFLAKSLEGFLVNGNLTILRSRITMPAQLGAFDPDLHFQGQSPYLVNLGLTYATPGSGFSASLLFNRFGDRILQYGAAGTSGSGGGEQSYNVLEKARSSLDGKIKVNVWRGWSLSLSGKNLLNTSSELITDGSPALIFGRSLSGLSISTGISYAH